MKGAFFSTFHQKWNVVEIHTKLFTRLAARFIQLKLRPKNFKGLLLLHLLLSPFHFIILCNSSLQSLLQCTTIIGYKTNGFIKKVHYLYGFAVTDIIIDSIPVFVFIKPKFI